MTPLPILLSVRLYRRLLLRYPRFLRELYGAEMIELFREQALERWRRGGASGLVTLWGHTLPDLLRPLPGPLGASATRAEPGPVAGEVIGRARGWLHWPAVREDLGFALRSLAREPRFSGLVIGVLAIGIALNVSVFAVLRAYLLRPLPYPAAERIVGVTGAETISWTEVDAVFEKAVSWDLDVFTLVGEGRPELARGAWITPDFLDVYAVRAQLGRTFRPDEAGRSAAPVAMISDRLWRDRFGADAGVIGRTFSAFTSDRPDHAELFTIVGVLPGDFWYFNDYTDVLAPIRQERGIYTGRLRPGVSTSDAESVLTELAHGRMVEMPANFRVQVVRLHDRHVAGVRPTLLVLQSAALLVLLIACANAAVLLLIRATRRGRELGIRRALGASRARLGRQLLGEGSIIALCAGAIGAGLAAVGLDLTRATLEARLGQTVPGGAEALSVDAPVLMASAGLCALVGVVFGLIPLLASGRVDLTAMLAEGRRGGTESRLRRRLRGAMVASEVALSLALLIGAGLMVRSAVNLQRQDLGFTPARLVLGNVGLREASYPEGEQRVRFFSSLAELVRAIPGVQSAALASDGVFTTRFAPRPVEGESVDGVLAAEAVSWLVDEEYFAAMEIGVQRGRPFSEDDRAGTDPVAVVSESLARDLWGAADPIGKGVRVPVMVMSGTARMAPGPWHRVVGVVEDVMRDVDGPGGGDVYMTYRQSSPLWMDIVARERPGAPAVVPEIEAAVQALDSEAPLSSVLRIEEAVREAMAPTRYLARLLVAFSCFALILAIVGLYGVVAYAARQHEREVAIHMALGADRGSVVALFLRQGLVVIGAGIAAGALAGLALAQALETRLYGVSANDALTHMSLAGVLALVATLAVWLPARSAARSEPMAVLRGE